MTRSAAAEGKTAAGGPGRAGRFELLRGAQRLLNDRAATIADQHPTVWCHRAIREVYADEASITVYRAADGSDASVHGLITCGNVWSCPVCSGKVAEERRRELNLAMVKAQAEGLHAYLLTLTFAHSIDDTLASLMERQAKALATFKQSRRYRSITARWGRVGSVKGLEITHGSNGWHPHTHDLIFAKPGMLDDLRTVRDLKRAWLEACLVAGLVPGARYDRIPGKRARRLTLLSVAGKSRLESIRNNWRHALDLTGGLKAAEYVAKFGRDEAWGMSAEVTRGASKTGTARSKWSDDIHVTPFQLLRFACNGDAPAGNLFREYVRHFHGKRQLVWSAGLKKRFGIHEATDEELAGGADKLPEREEVGTLTVREWSVVLSRTAVPELIRYAAEYCSIRATAQQDLIDFVRDLERRPPIAKGTVSRRSRIDTVRRSDLYFKGLP